LKQYPDLGEGLPEIFAAVGEVPQRSLRATPSPRESRLLKELFGEGELRDVGGGVSS